MKKEKIFEDLKCSVIDTESINEEIQKEHPGHKIQGKFAIIKNKFNNYLVFDEELVGCVINEDEKVDMYVYDHSNGISLFPKGTISFSAKEINSLIKEEKSLKEYMGDRFDYNSRVRENQETFVEWYIKNK